MSDSMRRNGSGGGSEPAAVQAETLESLWQEYNTVGKKVNEKLEQMKKPEFSLDVADIKGQISSLYLAALSIGTKILQIITADEKELKKLITWTKKDDIATILSDKLKSHVANAKKYGSTIKDEVPKTTLDDIKGQKKAKDIVTSFIFLAKHPELFSTYKMSGGLGMFMYGPPGTGKTMFAEAVAHEMGLPLFVVTPADIFKSYVGASEQAVKQIFQDISSLADGAIIFFDECESIFTRRGADSKDYKSAVTSELLQRMNGEGVDGSRRIMIAATNRPWDIDPAYLRYKRFSHLVHISPPDATAIESIVKAKLKNIPVEEGVVEYTIDRIIKRLQREGGSNDFYSAADICGIVEDACRRAIAVVMEKAMSDPSRGMEIVKVNKDMINAAVSARNPSIKAEDNDAYDKFTPEGMKD